ncbi:MAG TPA: YfhO family protein [Candidatus Obscuribacter sp.]|nr:YfhO family protein [Candidatus Obscuribacter sp.]
MRASTNRALTVLLPVVLLFLFIATYFAGPLSGHGSLSKAHMLAEWDSAFQSQSTGKSMAMDPSLVYLMLPSYLLKAKLWREGQVPLWNPYTGLGAPLAADPQTLAFSPLHIPLILAPSLATFNYILPMEVFLLGLFTFFLARNLKLSLPSCIFAMMTAALCPYHLYYLELLGNGFCVVPLAFWMVLRLSDAQERPFKTRLWDSWLSALGLAFVIFSAHVEMSFFAISLASLTMLVKTAMAAAQEGSAKTMTAVGRNFRLLVICGLFTMLLASPLLLPFLEFLKNSQCYKFGSGAPAYIPWQTLLFNSLSPGYGGASPSLGPLILPFILLAWAAGKDAAGKSVMRAFSLVAAASLAIMVKMPPLDSLLQHPPFSFLVVTYALPAALVCFSILGAFGLDEALKRSGSKAQIAPAAVAVLLLLLFPLIKRTGFSLACANFDLCIPSFAFNRHDVLRYSLVAAVFLLGFIRHRLHPSNKTAGFLVLTATASYLCLAAIGKSSMPVRPQFDYESNSAVQKLKEVTDTKGRMVASGGHLLRPNSNVVYQLKDLRSHNPLFPKRYLTFMQESGARVDVFSQEFEAPLSALLGAGSVNAVASLTPVRSLSDQSRAISETTHQEAAVRLPLTAKSGLSLELGKAQLDLDNRAVYLPVRLVGGTKSTLENLAIVYVLLSDKDDTLWFSDQQAASAMADAAEKEKLPQFVGFPLPRDLKVGSQVKLALQLFDTRAGLFLPVPDGKTSKNSAGQILTVVSLVKSPAALDTTAKDWQLVAETAERIRIYSNAGAFPRAYFSTNLKLVNSEEAALSSLKESAEKDLPSVILEREEKEREPTPVLPAISKPVQIVAETANQIKLKVETDRAGFVVLNDIYYPGWTARLDGKPVAIRKANYLMRAVACPDGVHELVFSYEPDSFKYGLLALATALLSGLVLFCRRRSLAGGSPQTEQAQ